MTSKCSHLYLYGDSKLYNRLFDLINSKNDSNSKNSIKIDQSTKIIRISTKYYETVIDLSFIENDFNQIEKDSSTDGLIAYFDENNFYKRINILEEYLKEKHLKLIIIENLEKFSKKNELVELSEENDFSLIDLSATDEDENSVDELINILYCHEWSVMNKIENKSNNASSVIQPQTSSSSKENEDEFENILVNLQDFRLKASKMEPTERKLFAQEIVTKFWSSIGGDGDELEGLSDLSDIE